MFAKTCKIYQQFKNRKTLYVHLPPKNIVEIKSWDTVYIDLIDQYGKSIRQQHPCGTIIRNNSILTCMTMIDLVTGWFEIFEMPTFDLDELLLGNDEYIYNYLQGLARCLTTHGYSDTRIHAKLCLTTDLSLNETLLLFSRNMILNPS